MTTLEAIGLIGGIASIAGFVYAIYYARTTARRKELVYDATPAVPLATIVAPEDEQALKITFRRRGEESEEVIRSAFVRFLRFANLGREPIRKSDIAPSNPLRLMVSGVRVLDISSAGARREVSRIEVTPVEQTTEGASALISFDFLDHFDGGLIKILTTEPEGEVQLLGDIIGMPEGIKTAADLRPRGVLNTLGCTLGVLLQISALVLTPLVYRWTTGGWEYVWLLVLPVLAVLLPGVLVGIIASTIWPDTEPRFPRELSPPKWFFWQLRYLEPIRPPHDPATAGFGVSVHRKKPSKAE